MAIYKLAPSSVVDSSPAKDVTKLTWTNDNLIEDSKYLFSAGPVHPSIVVNGDQAGSSLAKILSENDFRELGTLGRQYDGVPFSVRKLEAGSGELVYSPAKSKPAFWYITDAKENAAIALAKSGAVKESDLESALQANTWSELLQLIPVEEGDIFLIEQGVTYVLPEGVSVLEIETLAQGVEHDRKSIEEIHSEDYIADGQGECAVAASNNVIEFDLYKLDGRLDLKTEDDSAKVIVFLHGTAVVDSHDKTIHAQPDTVLFAGAGTDPFHIVGNCSFALIHLV